MLFYGLMVDRPQVSWGILENGQMEEAMSRYSIHFYKGSVLHAADYGWLKTGWAESEKDDIEWCPAALHNAGYDAMLSHFGLDVSGFVAPTYAEILKMSPADLLALRRKIEREKDLPAIYPTSDALGKHVRAEEVGHKEAVDA